MRSQNVLLSAAMIQEKALIFAKELNIENSKHQMVGYDVRRKKIT